MLAYVDRVFGQKKVWHQITGSLLKSETLEKPQIPVFENDFQRCWGKDMVHNGSN